MIEAENFHQLKIYINKYVKIFLKDLFENIKFSHIIKWLIQICLCFLSKCIFSTLLVKTKYFQQIHYCEKILLNLSRNKALHFQMPLNM